MRKHKTSGDGTQSRSRLGAGVGTKSGGEKSAGTEPATSSSPRLRGEVEPRTGKAIGPAARPSTVPSQGEEWPSRGTPEMRALLALMKASPPIGSLDVMRKVLRAAISGNPGLDNDAWCDSLRRAASEATRPQGKAWRAASEAWIGAARAIVAGSPAPGPGLPVASRDEVLDPTDGGVQACIPSEIPAYEVGGLSKVSASPSPTYNPVDWHPPGGVTIRTVLGWYKRLLDPDHAVELRALEYDPDGKGYARTAIGFFDCAHWEDMVREASKLSGKAKGVYITINPVRLDLLARINNRVKVVKSSGEGAADKDVVARRFLLVDVDPARLPGVSATAAEKAEARPVLEAAMDYLQGCGWPTPILADSGNGYHALYQIDLAADDGGLVKSCLQALALRFDTPQAKVDAGVSNPSRICKFYGTMAAKGDGTPDRPHRRSFVINIPDILTPVPRALLEALAAEITVAVNLFAPAKPTLPVVPEPGSTSVVERARSYVNKMPIAVQGQNGSAAAFAAACALIVGFGLKVDEALPLFREYSDRCEPPWSEKELIHKLEDAGKKAVEEPEQVGYLLRNDRKHQGEDVQVVDPFAGSAGDPPKPIPIRVDLPPVPKMAAKLLPKPFRPWLADIVRRVGCPLEYAAVAAIIAVAVLVGRRVAIRPKAHDDWTVVANLWAMVVGRPGELKSPALEEALRPLHRLVKEAEEQYQAGLKAFEAKATLEKLQHEAAKKSYQNALSAKTKDEALIEDLAAKVQSPPDDTPPVRKRYLVNDATVEKLLEILRENPNGVLIFRDELVGFFYSLDKPGRETDRAFYLESWNGTGSFTCDRIGRGTVHAEAICLSILGSIQPGPLARYIRGAASGNGKEDDGLISRFQLAVYPDPSTAWVNVDQPPDAASKNRAFEVFRKLVDLDPEAVGAEVDDHKVGLPFLRFSGDAQAFFDGWRAELENVKLRTEGEMPLIESHLAKYRSLMPSLALLFHLVKVVDGGKAGPVTLEAAKLSAAWCDLLEAHARRIYQASFDGDPEPARRLAERIRKGSLANPFTARQVAEHDWSGLATQDEVDRAVATLERHSWLRTVEVPTRGRPKTQIFVNPLVLKGAPL